MKYLVSNLKANFTLNDMEVYLKALKNIDTSKLNYIVCPSALYMYLFKDAEFKLGAQDVSVYPKGAYTGEKKSILFVVIPKRDYYKLKEGIKKIDNKAFFVVSSNYEVGGGK